MQTKIGKDSQEQVVSYVGTALQLRLARAIQERRFRDALEELHLYHSCFPEERVDGHILRLIADINPDEFFSSFFQSEQIDWPQIHVISNLCDGTNITSVNKCIDLAQHFAQRLPASYDAAWPVLELWEQIGHKVWVSPEATKLFVDRYFETCVNTQNEYLSACGAWGCNEFLERGCQESIGLEIANRLTQSNRISIRQVLCVLSTLRTNLRRQLGQKIPSEDAEVANLRKIVQRGKRRLNEGSRNKLKSPFPCTDEIKELMSFWSESKGGEGLGVAAMGYSKHILRRAAELASGNYQLIKELALPILQKADRGQISSFLAIESLEAVRDEAAVECAQMMGEYLRHVRNKNLAFGIGVCMTEHYEEHGEQSIMARWRFARRPGAWIAVEQYPQLPKSNQNKLDCFFDFAARSLNARPDLDALVYWINRRLDQHPSTLLANRK